MDELNQQPDWEKIGGVPTVSQTLAGQPLQPPSLNQEDIETGVQTPAPPSRGRPTPPPWDAVKDDFVRQFPALDPEMMRTRYEQGLALTEARNRYAVPDWKDTAAYTLVTAAPIVGSLMKADEAKKYQAAKERFIAGNPQKNDYDIIGIYESRQKALADQGILGHAAQAGANLTAMLGEMSLLPGVGRAAMVAKTPFTPSLWLGEAAQRSAEQGGSVYSPKNILPPMAMGGLQNLILGSLGEHFAGTPNPVARFLQRTLAGASEMEGVSVVGGLLDKILPEAYQTHTGFGTLGALLRGDQGEAVKQGTLNLAMNAVFAALHGRRDQAEQLFESFSDSLKYAKKQGLTPEASVQRAQQRISGMLDAFQKELADQRAAALQDAQKQVSGENAAMRGQFQGAIGHELPGKPPQPAQNASTPPASPEATPAAPTSATVANAPVDAGISGQPSKEQTSTVPAPTGPSAEQIASLGQFFGLKQGAKESLEDFAQRIRKQPGAEALIQGLDFEGKPVSQVIRAEPLPPEEPQSPPSRFDDPKTFEEFKAKQQEFLTQAAKYTNKAGESVFTEKMADLADRFPEWQKRLDAEAEQVGANGKPLPPPEPANDQARQDFIANRPKPARGTTPPTVEELASWLPKQEGKPGLSIEPEHTRFGVVADVKNVVFRNEQGKPVGVLKVFVDKNGVPDLLSVAVDPAYRRRGIATQLYEHAKANGLDVDKATGAGGYTEEGAAFAYSRKQAANDQANVPPPESPPPAPPPEPLRIDATNFELSERAKAANLNDQERMVIQHRLEGFSLPEIGKIMGFKGLKQRPKQIEEAAMKKMGADFSIEEWKQAQKAGRARGTPEEGGARGAKIDPEVAKQDAALREAAINRNPDIVQAIPNLHTLKGQDLIDAITAFDDAKLAPKEKAPPSVGRPGTPELGRIYEVPTANLHRDPERFQYKVSGIGEGGVGAELKGVKWNPNFAGVISVWRDPATGKDYVVNGHHRHELAQRSGAPSMHVQYLKADTAAEARAIGALINIAEGRGTAVDAAKYLRDTGRTVEDLASQGVSLRGPVARDGAILAKLSDSLFNRVAQERMPIEQGLAIASELADHNLQDQLMKVIDAQEAKGRDLSPKIIREMARMVAQTPTVKSEGHDLFGDFEEEKSLFVPRAEITSYIRDQLSKRARDFRAVSNENRAGVVAAEGNVLNVGRNQAVAAEAERLRDFFDQQVNLKGPLSDRMNEFAKELSDATTRSQRQAVLDKAARFVQADLPALVDAAAGGARPASAERAAGQPNDAAVAARAAELQKQGYSAKAARDRAERELAPQQPEAMGAAALGEVGYTTSDLSDPRLTALAHERSDAIRQALGLPERAPFHGLTDEQLPVAAQAAIQADPGYPERLIAELTATPRPTNSLETAVLLRHETMLENLHYQALKIADDEMANQLQREIERTRGATDPAGSEAGHAFRVRRLLMDDDFSIIGMLRSFRDRIGRDPTPEELAIIEQQAKRIEELQARIKELQKQGHIRPGGPSDEGFEIEQIKKRFRRTIDDEVAQQGTWKQKALRLTGELYNIPRSIMASIDFPLLRQGAMAMASHPIRTSKGIPEMFRSFFSQEVADRAEYEIHHRPNSGLYEKAGLDLTRMEGPLTGHEEEFLSRAIGRIPILGAVPKASERAFQTIMNRIRADSFDAMAQALAVNGKIKGTDARIIANYANVMTGRGNLGRARPAAGLLAEVFFAPRWAISRFQVLLGQPLWFEAGRGGTQARLLVAKEYARVAAGMGVALGLAALAGFGVEKDPRSPDFGKVKIGNTRLDFTGGLASVGTFLSRMFTVSKKSPTGKISSLYAHGQYGEDTAADVAERYARGKLAPIPSTALDALSGKTVTGEPVTPAQAFSRMGMSLFAKDVYDAIQDLGVPAGIAVSLLGLLGMSMQTYDPKAKKKFAPAGPR